MKQKKFADEYIITGNAYQSAVKAGYSESYARADSSKLLENTGIKRYIDERLKEIDKEKTAEATEVMQYLTSVMRGELTDQILRTNPDGSQAIIEKRVDVKDRTRAAELIGKRYRMWTDKVEAEVQGMVVFENEEGIKD